MKSILLVIAITLLSLQIQARIMGQIGAGIDLNGKHTFSNNNLGSDSSVNPGMFLYLEGLTGRSIVLGELILGLGLEYQIPRDLKLLSPTQHRRQYSYLPIYITAKYVILPLPITPEVIMQAGYNYLVNHKNFEVNDGYKLSANGGFYWAAGVGLDIKPMVMQLMYKSNQSSFEWNDVNLQHYKTNNMNTQISLQLGVRL